MAQPVRQGRQQRPSHAGPARRLVDTEADHLEVTAEPVGRDGGVEDGGGAVGPPLAVLAGVAVREPHQRPGVPRQCQPEPLPRCVPVPHLGAPGLDVLDVVEHPPVDQPELKGQGLVGLVRDHHVEHHLGHQASSASTSTS